MADNNPNLQQVDSFDEVYDYAVGMKSEFDKAYEKWAKKRNIKVGWSKQSYKSEETLEKEGEKAKAKRLLEDSKVKSMKVSKRKTTNAKKRKTTKQSRKAS